MSQRCKHFHQTWFRRSASNEHKRVVQFAHRGTITLHINLPVTWILTTVKDIRTWTRRCINKNHLAVYIILAAKSDGVLTYGV